MTGLNGKKIVLVDDSQVVLDLYRTVLTMQGVEVLLANDGVEALELLSHEKVDMVITDLMMPEMDGVALIKEIRERKIMNIDGFELPVVAMSSQGNMIGQLQTLKQNLNVAETLTLPISPAQMIKTVTTLLVSPD